MGLSRGAGAAGPEPEPGPPPMEHAILTHAIAANAPCLPCCLGHPSGRLLMQHIKLGTGAIIANPNCSTIIALMAVTPLDRVAGVKRMVVSTYQVGAHRPGEALPDCLPAGLPAWVQPGHAGHSLLD